MDIQPSSNTPPPKPPQFAPTPHVPDPVTPLASNMLPEPRIKRTVSPLLYILIAVFAVGTLVFGIYAATLYNTAQTATNTLNAQKADSAKAGAAAQKKADDEANRIANEEPYRSYVAPVPFGAFEVKFPKNWSSYVDEEPSGTQVNIIINPDFIRKTNGTEELAAARVYLITQVADTYMNKYKTEVTQGKVKKNEITVSGLKGYDFTGTFNDKRTTRAVVVPVRDKTIAFINENSKYSQEFAQIVSQAKINP